MTLSLLDFLSGKDRLGSSVSDVFSAAAFAAGLSTAGKNIRLEREITDCKSVFEEAKEQLEDSAKAMFSHGVIDLAVYNKICECGPPHVNGEKKFRKHSCGQTWICPFCHIRRYGFRCADAFRSAYKRMKGFSGFGLLPFTAYTKIEPDGKWQDLLGTTNKFRDSVLLRIRHRMEKMPWGGVCFRSHFYLEANQVGSDQEVLEGDKGYGVVRGLIFTTRPVKAIHQVIESELRPLGAEFRSNLTLINPNQKKLSEKFLAREMMYLLLRQSNFPSNLPSSYDGMCRDIQRLNGRMLSFWGNIFPSPAKAKKSKSKRQPRPTRGK